MTTLLNDCGKCQAHLFVHRDLLDNLMIEAEQGGKTLPERIEEALAHLHLNDHQIGRVR